MYASEYISKHPSKVAGAVLIEPGPLTGALFEEVKADIIDFDFFSEWLNDFTWAEAIVSPDDHARADFLRLVGMLTADAQPGYGDAANETPYFWREGAVANAAVQADGMKDGKGNWDFTTGLLDFEPLVQFVASENNTVIGAAFQKRQMRFYRAAELTVIADSGHELPTVQPEQTLRVIQRYLAEINF